MDLPQFAAAIPFCPTITFAGKVAVLRAKSEVSPVKVTPIDLLSPPEEVIAVIAVPAGALHEIEALLGLKLIASGDKIVTVNVALAFAAKA